MQKVKTYAFQFLISLLITGCAGSAYDLGRTFLRTAQYDQAVEHFRTAVKIDSSNYKNWRELGVAYFKTGKTDSALSSLRFANELNPDDSKTTLYMHTLFREDIRASIKNEPTATPDSTIAVLYFDNANKTTQMEPLSKGLAEVLSYGLSQVKAFRVLERIRQEILLQELQMGDGRQVLMKNAARTGRLLGARTLIIGNFTALTNRDIRVNASLVSTETGEIQDFEHVAGSTDDIFRLVGALTRKITAKLDIVLTDEERRAIYEAPTEGVFDFLTYSKEIQSTDEEMIKQLREIGSLEFVLDNGSSARLAASGAQVNAGILPGQDERDSIQEANGDPGFQGVPVEIEIIIPSELNQ